MLNWNSFLAKRSYSEIGASSWSVHCSGSRATCLLFYEEPTLRRTFRAKYDALCANVPRWINPRIRHKLLEQKPAVAIATPPPLTEPKQANSNAPTPTRCGLPRSDACV